MSDKKYKSLLDELDRMVPQKDKYTVIESRAHHYITSGISLIRLIEENFSLQESDELKRRLFNSLKRCDHSKFQRKIRQIKENKNG